MTMKKTTETAVRTGTESVTHMPLAIRILLRLAQQAQYGSLTVTLPDGSLQRVDGPHAGPAAQIEIHRTRLVRRFLAGGTAALLESYADADWDTRNLAVLLEWGAVNEPYFGGTVHGRSLFRLIGRLRHRLRPNSRRGSRRNIAYHYDLGNDFYRLWLDESLGYSGAVYETADDTLARAQYNKYRRIIDLLGLKEDHHLLEIGSGWGGFAIQAALRTGCRVTSVTVSRAQLEEAQWRAEAAGVADRVEFRFQDYRDVSGRYDRIASIEMFEAVGEQYWQGFFRSVHDRLRPGGAAALQVITIDEAHFEHYRRTPDFIQRYIFPGGMLPSPERFMAEARSAGLHPGGQQFFGQHYARTLADWERRFFDAEAAVRAQGFDSRFIRMWHAYLAYCRAGFQTGRIDLMHALLQRPERDERGT
ncbi:cyclopropane-fatty-acyl-phospholipid synthase family protein [Thioalkalivibrio sp. ALJT]|uniref:SAM-dependent methyltransferase n=1 Tax=Thioalkalivibrio sp. ALJT TaxID=1158146 RepID=UPI00035F30D2|nr:cyclopropane-fatty-acyl-phospholipid synthase family protein [Thioalkalivibrio sp. ALJT]